MLMMFPGLNREGEMSAMISALTHVICGDDHNHNNDENQNMISAIQSSTSLSYGDDSSALKRRREDGGFLDIKHQGEYLYYK